MRQVSQSKRCAILLVALGVATNLFSDAIPSASALEPYYLVSDYLQGKVLRYALDGTYINDFKTGLGTSAEMSIGPDGRLYVASSTAQAILRFDPITGQQFSSITTAGFSPRGFTWGPNGNLFAARAGGGIQQFDGNTGAYLGQFATQSSTVACEFDGDLIVAFGQLSNPQGVNRFNAQTGAFISTFASPPNTSLPTDILIAPDGDIYIANQGPGTLPVVRMDRATGLRDQSFAPNTSFFNPVQLKFSPTGELWEVDGAAAIKRLDPNTGTFLGNFISDPAHLSSVADIVFVNVPEPSILSLVLIFTTLIALSRRHR